MRSLFYLTVCVALVPLFILGPVTRRAGGQSPPPAPKRLMTNWTLESASADKLSPEGFELVGDAEYGYLSTVGGDVSGWGVRLHSNKDINHDGQLEGKVTRTISSLPTDQRWYRLRILGLAQEDFSVARDQLYLQVEFFKDQGRDPLDQIKKQFYAQVERERIDLKDEGTNENPGLAMWRVYEFDFRTPFPEIDTLQIGVGFAEGTGQGEAAEFQIDTIELAAISDPSSLLPGHVLGDGDSVPKAVAPVAIESLVKIGGRWYFDPRGGDRTPPIQFDRSNVDQLYYDAGRLETPFVDNTTAWLREGWLDANGKLVEKDQFIPDNVVITWTPTHLVIQSKNLPNHTTATFPDRWRTLDGNPNYIQQKDTVWHLPFDPEPNARALAMTVGNDNGAVNGGPIGVAINGVVFFNPYDAGSVDAIWRLDRCCGHPSPNEMYHYHKYPVCLNTPWADEGKDHSPLIGFAFDGFPIYGPYESEGVMAKDDATNPLNDFNIHHDDLRGWHYHVTPGRFPHVIGGYWGTVESRNVRRGPRLN